MKRFLIMQNSAVVDDANTMNEALKKVAIRIAEHRYDEVVCYDKILEEYFTAFNGRKIMVDTQQKIINF